MRLKLVNVGGGWPGELDKSTLGHPGKYTYCVYTYCVAENEAASLQAPYHDEKSFSLCACRITDPESKVIYSPTTDAE